MLLITESKGHRTLEEAVPLLFPCIQLSRMLRNRLIWNDPRLTLVSQYAK